MIAFYITDNSNKKESTAVQKNLMVKGLKWITLQPWKNHEKTLDFWWILQYSKKDELLSKSLLFDNVSLIKIKEGL